jgi:hypothetical protein
VCGLILLFYVANNGSGPLVLVVLVPLPTGGKYHSQVKTLNAHQSVQRCQALEHGMVCVPLSCNCYVLNCWQLALVAVTDYFVCESAPHFWGRRLTSI